MLHFSRLFQDLRFASRMLHRKPGYFLASVVTLTLGLTSTTLIFSLTYDVLKRYLILNRSGWFDSFRTETRAIRMALSPRRT